MYYLKPLGKKIADTGVMTVTVWLLALCSPGSRVYVCKGPQSVAYHRTNTCRGLSRCSTTIEDVDLQTAKKELHRRACRYCY